MSPNSEQAKALLEVFRQFNTACNWISEVAFAEKAFRQVPLHAACYHMCRDKFALPSQLAVRAIGKALAVENLTGIRERANGYAAEMRWLMGSWAFSQLKQFVLYKAADVGLAVYEVDPRNTSRTCSACGHCEKANRKS